tara:strand:+ start:2237 stop:3727 length:1491 start_codon:yes stop_codon:yes gene_type:complete
MSNLWFNQSGKYVNLVNNTNSYYPPVNPVNNPPGTPSQPTGTPLLPNQPLTTTGTNSVNTINCDSCNNGAPQGSWYVGNTCPTGTIPAGTGNPCASNPGLLVAQVYNIVANYGGSALYSNTTGPSYSAGMRGQIAQVYPGNPKDYTINWEDGTSTSVAGESTTLYTITGFQVGDRVKKNQYNLFGSVMSTIGSSIQVRWDDNTTSTEMVSNQIFVGTGSPVGCTNSTSTNYNPNSTSDDGSCIIGGCTDPVANNVLIGATFDDGSCTYNGCTDSLSMNFNPLATIDDGSCISSIQGCVDDTALNYNALANIDDGSCSYPVEGCTNPDASNFQTGSVIDDGSCIIEGCMDSTKFGYNPEATQDDGSCEEIYSGCNLTDADNYDYTANTNDGSCVYTGCTDPTALNESVLAEGTDATIISDDSLCEYPTTGGPTPPPIPYIPPVQGPSQNGTDDKVCKEGEMDILGQCIKKNLVIAAVAGVVLYYAYSKGMLKQFIKK